MSAQLIIVCMKKLVQVHRTFNDLAEEKTVSLTKGDISHLRSLLQKESAILKQLQQLEQERARLVRFFINGKGLVTEGGTLNELIPHVTNEEKEELVSLQKDLIEQIEILKKKNELNQQLIQDSLRFVNLSLDVLQPELDTGNYGRPNTDDDEPMGRSLFDSKA
uniref:Flagellar protein FlgN n=2 Tax=Anaerobacillus isosaccharinicus TaxID=1532552 RepID=A0A1S2L917_9BACI